MTVANPPVRLMTELDHLRVSNLVRVRGRLSVPESLAPVLEDLIDAAELVDSRVVPPDVVTMNSQVLIADQPGGAQRQLTLCYPADAEPATGCVSVLSPVGAALLGLSVGQLASWETPQGETASAQIVSLVFQPEESGDYLL
jgi:regulator of nucleoside diphosphate kinase